MAETEQLSLITQAGEYVLGTLDGTERERFQQQLVHDGGARRELAYWEQRLGSIGLGLAPVAPPAAVWARIEGQMVLDRKTPGASAQRPAERDPNSGAASSKPAAVSIWRGLAIAASVAALVMAGLLFTGTTPDSRTSAAEPAYASVVYDEPTGMSWLVTAKQGGRIMTVLAMGDFDVPKGKVLCAWFKPDEGQPMRLGEWPHSNGEHKMTVSEAVAKSMDEPAHLMVTLEDAGIVRTAPEGKLMWKSPIGRHTS